jgi:hypothetical protein
LISIFKPTASLKAYLDISAAKVQSVEVPISYFSHPNNTRIKICVPFSASMFIPMESQHSYFVERALELWHISPTRILSLKLVCSIIEKLSHNLAISLDTFSGEQSATVFLAIITSVTSVSKWIFPATHTLLSARL